MKIIEMKICTERVTKYNQDEMEIKKYLILIPRLLNFVEKSGFRCFM